MIDFAGVKAITIPEGAVKKITVNDVTVWKKPEAPQFYTVTITDQSGQFNIVLSGGYASIKIAGTNCKAGTYTANPGDALIITALKTGNRSAVVVNGETVVSQTSNKFTYEHIITGNVAFVFKMQEINSQITSVYEITSS